MVNVSSEARVLGEEILAIDPTLLLIFARVDAIAHRPHVVSMGFH